MPQKDKIFGIGLNKTGTSTLALALKLLGYRVCGPRRQLLRSMRRGDFSGVDEIVRNYDAFEDMPWPLLTERLLDSYGARAKFILTVRVSPEKWFNSVENHARANGLLTDTWSLGYGWARPFGREKEFIDAYLSHNEWVRNLFKSRGLEDRLIELCFERGDKWPELCNFIGEPIPDAPFPHGNPTDLKKKRFNRALNGLIVEPLYRRYAKSGWFDRQQNLADHSESQGIPRTD